SRDHYRRALTAYGPHTADYMVTRMVRLAESLKGGPAPSTEPLDPLAQADEQREEALAAALGQLSSSVYDTWLASLPNDVGPAKILQQPKNITRFQAATFTWRGGSNAVDNPVARVERLMRRRWAPFADPTGHAPPTGPFRSSSIRSCIRAPTRRRSATSRTTGTNGSAAPVRSGRGPRLLR